MPLNEYETKKFQFKLKNSIPVFVNLLILLKRFMHVAYTGGSNFKDNQLLARCLLSH